MKRLNTKVVYDIDRSYIFSEKDITLNNKSIIVEVENKISKVADKVRNTFSNLITPNVKDNKIDSVFSKPNNNKDHFHKENNEYNKITKKVNINGQEFVMSASSCEEMSNRINKLTKSNGHKKQDENPLLFPSLYTEQKEIETNEWVQKRDVWSDEYIFA